MAEEEAGEIVLMSLPVWATEAKDEEDDLAGRRRKYGRISGSVLIVLALSILLVSFEHLLNSSTVQGALILTLFGILALTVFEDDIIGSLHTPSYQRLGAVLCVLSETLGNPNDDAKRDFDTALKRGYALVKEQQPEFEEKDLVFGIALSVLRKLTDLFAHVKSASKSQLSSETIQDVKSNLSVLGSEVYRSKTINDSNIEALTDNVLSSFQQFPVVPPTPILRRLSTWFSRRSPRETFFIETLLSLMVSAFGTIVFGIGIFEAVLLFLALLVVLALAEDRLFRKG